MNKVIKRITFWRMVNKKIPDSINKKHVLSIINILFDEISKDLFNGIDVKIKNFGTFKKDKYPPRKHMNFYTKEMSVSKGRNYINFKLDRKFYKFLKESLDPCKTFGGG